MKDNNNQANHQQQPGSETTKHSHQDGSHHHDNAQQDGDTSDRGFASTNPSKKTEIYSDSGKHEKDNTNRLASEKGNNQDQEKTAQEKEYAYKLGTEKARQFAHEKDHAHKSQPSEKTK